MELYVKPAKEQWVEIFKRPVFNQAALNKKVQEIINQVKQKGDKALIDYALKFDKVNLSQLLVSAEEIDQSAKNISTALKDAIKIAIKNITAFHSLQVKSEPKIETMPGVVCWRKITPIEKVGLYIPGGSAPLFSTVLMLAIPAKLANCKEIVLCTPPDKNGNIHPAILYAAKKTGVTKIFKIGGAQAIAAMAFGTESIPKVYKIFGPGNQYVNCAKQLVQSVGVAIDMPAGPSEVCVMADETANPKYIAADLLSQAEHGADSQVVFITTNKKLVDTVSEEIQTQLASLPRKDLALASLKNSKAIVAEDKEEMIEMVNNYAPEHLIINCKNEEKIVSKIVNAGSIFLGNYSPESVGDYASGTNHTLPTNGYATAFSGVSVDHFVKKITCQKLSEKGLRNIASTVVEMALAEGLTAHANAVLVRM